MTGLTDEDIQSLANHLLAETLRLTPPHSAPEPEEEQIYRLAASLLVNTLSEHLLRTLAPRRPEPEPEPEPEEGILTTIQDLINQPFTTVVRSASGAVYERGSGTSWYVTGTSGPRPSGEIELPARVLS